MVTLGMDLGSFSLGKPLEKLPESIPLMTPFLLIGQPWRIIYVCSEMYGRLLSDGEIVKRDGCRPPGAGSQT